MKETKAKLIEALNAKIEDLSAMTPGTDEHAKAAEDVSKLYRMVLDVEKEEFNIEKFEVEQNLEDARYQREREAEDRKHTRELDKEKRDAKRSWIQFGITTAVTVASTVGSFLFFKHRYHEGLEFEKTGTYTAREGAQSIMRMMKPKIHH